MFQKIKTPGIAHVSYLFGDKGEAAVVDPRRDFEEYLKVARENKLTIKWIFETHRQEDFVVGSLELAKQVGAKIVTLDRGALMMFGARMAKGCTSGHGISGMLQLAGSSWLFSPIMAASASLFARLLYQSGAGHAR